MSYQVIARKWRPQTFREILGQSHVTQTLENAIRAGRVAHAYIFSGARGVGKTTTARVLAKALNCAKGPTPEPCNQCDSCREIAAGTSLDVIEIDAASNRGIDQIRELREMVRYAPAASRFKVLILDEAHQLTDEASNALLKTLEEPPEKVIFVLATTRPEDLVDTIKSRAQHFHFRSLAFAEIVQALEHIAAEEKLAIDSGALAVMARAAEGSVRDALSLLEQAIAYCGETITDAQVRVLLGVVPEEVLDELVGALAAGSSERVLALIHKLIADGQNLQHFCREAIRHVRNLLVARVCGAASELIAAHPTERSRLAEQAAQFSEEDLTRFFQVLLITDDDLRRKPDPRLHTEMGLLRLVNAARLAPLEEILTELRGPIAGSPGRPRDFHPAQSAGAQRAPQSGSRGASAEPKGSVTADVGPIPAESKMAVDDSSGSPSGEMVAGGPVPTPASSALAAPIPRAHAEDLRSSGEPLPAAPPRIVARVAEGLSGLGAAQVDAIRLAIGERQEKFLSSLVEHVTRWELEGSEMRLYFPTEVRSLAELLQAREPIEKLRSIISHVMGQPLRVCVRLDTERRAAAFPAAASNLRDAGVARAAELRAQFEQDPIVRAMLERFGGQISGVKPPGEN